MMDYIHFFFNDKILQYHPGWPRTDYVDQVDLKHLEIHLPLLLGLKVCTTVPGSLLKQ